MLVTGGVAPEKAGEEVQMVQQLLPLARILPFFAVIQPLNDCPARALHDVKELRLRNRQSEGRWCRRAVPHVAALQEHETEQQLAPAKQASGVGEERGAGRAN